MSCKLFSFRPDDNLFELHGSGLHCVPHIGVYGEEYSIAFPMMIVSLNPTLGMLDRVPSSILAALQINIDAEQDAICRKIAQRLISSVIESALKHIKHFYRQRAHKLESTEVPIRQVSFMVSDDEDDDGLPNLPEEASEVLLRKIAQTLVRKVLHSACTLLEPLPLSSSMEELVSNTKRLKISVSPCRTPPLHARESSDTCSNKNKHSIDCVLSDSEKTADKTSFSMGLGSLSTHDQSVKKLGKKRQRSASHEANMEKDLEKLNLAFNSKLQLSHSSDSSKDIGQDQTVKDIMPSSDTYFPSFHRPIQSIISDIRKMSIMEADETEADQSTDDEEGTICLPAITRPPVIFEDVEAEQKNSMSSYSVKSPEPNYDAQPLPFVYDLDYYVVIHSCPSSGQCQKFLCQNTNEVNLIFHCWLYKNVPFHPSISVNEQVDMGIFDPEGAVPVHLDLTDAGIPFLCLEPRSVCIHSLCFSPENAQLQLPYSTTSFRSFYSIGTYHDRKVLTFHILPTSKRIEEDVFLLIHKCDDNLSEFIELFPLESLQKTLNHLLQPIL